MRRVLVFGAFDGLHPGHIDFFKKAKNYGDYLIVSVGTDKNVEKIKGEKPLFSQEERLDLVSQIKIIDEVLLGVEVDFYKNIKMINPDVICLGYDQWAKEKDVEAELARVGLTGTLIVRLSAHIHNRAKSTHLKKRSVDF